MKRILALIFTFAFLTAGSCQNCPQAPDGSRKCPQTTGGAAGTGGASAGGNLATGGISPAGGAVSTGGSLVAPCPVISALQPIPAGALKAVKPKHHKLAKWRPSHNPHRAKSTLERLGAAQICPVWHQGPDYALDQDISPWTKQPTGSCTGNAGVGMLAFAPLSSTTHYNELDAQYAYQGGTCIDNGCSTPCTCASCPAAFCPQTGVNDNGSTGASVDQWMTQQGWLKGYSTADTINALIAGVQISACELGSPWTDKMMNVTSGCEITGAGPANEGHEFDIVIHLPSVVIAGKTTGAFIMRNSWGDENDGEPWGCCVKNPDGTIGCGYAYMTDATVQTLFTNGAEANCPDL